jgi:intein/homing endonuclease
MKVRLNDQMEVVCTEDHKFLATEGWIEAKDLAGKELVRDA